MFTQLHEQYRPTQWSEVVGQDKAIRQIDALRPRGLSGRAFFLTGQSGTGKTTIAKLIASEIADDLNVTELTARRLKPEQIVETARAVRCKGIGAKSGQAVIVNEIQGLSRACIETLLDVLESVPPHVVWLFTTTVEGQGRLFDEQEDATAWHSRCQHIALARRDLCKPFAQRLREVAIKEGLDGGQPIEAFEKLLKSCGNNLREAMQVVERAEMVTKAAA